MLLKRPDVRFKHEDLVCNINNLLQKTAYEMKLKFIDLKMDVHIHHMMYLFLVAFFNLDKLF